MNSQKPSRPQNMITRALGRLKTLRMRLSTGVISTKLDAPESPLPLPVELIVQILSLLIVSDLLRCRLVSLPICGSISRLPLTCKQIQLVVDLTPELQYNIELAASCCCNNPANKTMDVPRRLRFLKNSEAFWKNPRFKPVGGQIIPQEPINYYFHGNLFIMYKWTQDLGHGRLWNALDCIALESNDRLATTVDKWSLTFPFAFEKYAVDADHDTLVLLQWGPRTVYTHGDWTFVIHIVSLQNGSEGSDELIEVQAPRRDYEECPALDIQGDMIAVVAGGLHGAVSDQERILNVVIINRKTGLVYARLTRRCEYGLECNLKSFIFASPTTFLLAVRCDGYFAVEVYSIADHCDLQLDVIEPDLVATYQFPPFQKGGTSSGSWDSFGKAYCGSIAHKLDPRPFVPNYESTIIYINRLYCGSPPLGVVRLNTFVQLSTFLSSVELYKQRKATGETSPMFLPWNAWGPASARCFNDTCGIAIRATPVVEYGNHVFQAEDIILDFNQPGIMRDLNKHGVSTQTALGPKPKPKLSVSRAASQMFTRSSALKDVIIPGTTGRIVRRSTVVPAGNIFVDDIVTLLPYRETRITWMDWMYGEPKVYAGSEIYSAAFPTMQLWDEPGGTVLVYRALAPAS